MLGQAGSPAQEGGDRGREGGSRGEATPQSWASWRIPWTCLFLIKQLGRIYKLSEKQDQRSVSSSDSLQPLRQ